jgi:hypothetical protein
MYRKREKEKEKEKGHSLPLIVYLRTKIGRMCTHYKKCK